MAANDRLLPSLADPPADTPALRFPERTLDYPALRAAAAQVAHDVAAARRIAVWAEPRPETCVASSVPSSPGSPPSR